MKAKNRLAPLESQQCWRHWELQLQYHRLPYSWTQTNHERVYVVTLIWPWPMALILDLDLDFWRCTIVPGYQNEVSSSRLSKVKALTEQTHTHTHTHIQTDVMPKNMPKPSMFPASTCFQYAPIASLARTNTSSFVTSVQLTFSILHHVHISNASTSFLLTLVDVQVSDAYSATFQTVLFMMCFFCSQLVVGGNNT